MMIGWLLYVGVVRERERREVRCEGFGQKASQGENRKEYQCKLAKRRDHITKYYILQLGLPRPCLSLTSILLSLPYYSCYYHTHTHSHLHTHLLSFSTDTHNNSFFYSLLYYII